VRWFWNWVSEGGGIGEAGRRGRQDEGTCDQKFGDFRSGFDNVIVGFVYQRRQTGAALGS